MDNQTVQPLSDDQELARVLAGVNAEAEGVSSVGLTPADDSTTDPVKDESGGEVVAVKTSNGDDKTKDKDKKADSSAETKPEEITMNIPMPPLPIAPAMPGDLDTLNDTGSSDNSAAPIVPTRSGDGALDNIPSDLAEVKKEAIVELKPLVGRLNIEADEKFDTYLLLIRSTDDKSLIAPAYEAAKSISDETKKAEALLDIIKEIDFLSSQK